MSHFGAQSLRDIAATLPGATAVFRANRLDFCCGGATTLAAAAAERGLELSRLEAELAALDPGAPPEAPTEPTALIAHILKRYHEVHRRELPELIRLARRVEAAHKDHPERPVGLVAALEKAAGALDLHMMKEERVLFPMMEDGGHPMINHPIAQMRFEHDEHGERLSTLEEITHGTTLPADACPTWRALYAGVRKLIEDVHQHVHLENNLLFPRFEHARTEFNEPASSPCFLSACH